MPVISALDPRPSALVGEPLLVGGVMGFRSSPDRLVLAFRALFLPFLQRRPALDAGLGFIYVAAERSNA
jgi:hypothetical protein